MRTIPLSGGTVVSFTGVVTEANAVFRNKTLKNTSMLLI